jgi:hypothetical protein
VGIGGARGEWGLRRLWREGARVVMAGKDRGNGNRNGITCNGSLPLAVLISSIDIDLVFT